MEIQITSFGFSNGLPVNPDMIFDARILPNPHYVDSLKTMDGLNKKIKDYVLKEEYSIRFLNRLKDFINFFIRNYRNSKKQDITIIF